VTTENIDPEVELRRIHALVLEREPDERGRLMAPAFTEHGLPVVLVLNAN
jgi:translation initiation factor 2B subunit (eIF-2B alpha/beta/delta family)